MPEEKQQFKNQTDGWIGVVVLGARGEERGAAVEPQGTVWLSEIEMKLTANAPRSPADNPFVTQTRVRTVPETGEQEEYEVTPLVRFNEDRFVPSDERFVPGFGQTEVPPHDERKPIQDGIEYRPVPVVPEEGPGVREPGLPPGAMPPAQQAPKPPARAAAAVAASQPEEDAVDDETAIKVDPEVGEETGAAQEPQGTPVEGEYAMAEEVGTPEAPRAPYVPPEE